MTSSRPFSRRLVLAAIALLVFGCASPPTATPLPPTVTVAPTATNIPFSPTPQPFPTATIAPSPVPTADAYSGWQVVETNGFSIRLPAGWQVMNLSEADLAKMLTDLQPYQEVIGRQPDPAASARGLDLVALSGQDSDLSDNLNIRHMPLGAQRFADTAALLAAFAPQMQVLGFEVIDPRADLRTDGGLPMARLAFRLTPTMKGQLEARGEQYYVLTETDLWVLTFTATGMQVKDAPPEFEQSARTFAPG